MKPLDLANSKSAFLGSTERDYLCKIAHHYLLKNNIKWLDIGSGDGISVSGVLNKISLDKKIDAITIDPNHEHLNIDGLTSGSVTHFHTKFENFDYDGVFDCVNLRHSIYYLNNIDIQLSKIAKLVAPEGICIVTCWTKNCFLRLVHDELARFLESQASIIETDSLDILFLKSKLQLEYRQVFRCEIDREKLLSDNNIAVAIANLASRNLPIENITDHAKINLVRECIHSRTKDIFRSNSISVFIKKSPHLGVEPLIR